jgi:hypothetical protein
MICDYIICHGNNLGIAIVIPASKIWEVISQPVIRNAENQIVAKRP